MKNVIEILGSKNQVIAVLKVKEMKTASQPVEVNEGVIAPGAILVSSWGFEQTNYDFYKVLAVTPKGQATIVKLQAQHTPDGVGTMVTKVVPLVAVDAKEKPLRRKVKNYGYDMVNINEYAGAYVWDGKVKRASHYA